MAMGKSAKEEPRTSDLKPQVFTAVTSDFETGAKAAARTSKDGEVAHTARDLVFAISALPEMRVKNYDAAETEA